MKRCSTSLVTREINQNYNEIPLYTSRMTKIKNITLNVSKNVKKLESSHIACRNVNWGSCSGKQSGSSKG